MSQTTDRHTSKCHQLSAVLYWPPLFLLVFVMFFVLSVPAAVAVWIIYWKVVPAYSANTRIANIETILTLRFYYTEDENIEHGRYLYVNSPKGSIKIAMTAFDWAHNGRTSIYLTPQRKIGVVGPIGDDYLVSFDRPTTDAARGPSDDWTYLGAFDFGVGIEMKRQLRFFSAAEQSECIPMRGAPIEDYQVRKGARREDCSH